MLASLMLLSVVGASPMYVQASRLNVRKAPDAKSKIVAKLAVGMKVDVLERKSDFVRIQRKKVSGWASVSLLTDKPVGLNDLLIKFDAAKTLEEKRRWIERAAALAPRSSEVLEHLVTTLQELGDTKALAQARLGLAAAAGKPNHNIHLVHMKSGLHARRLPTPMLNKKNLKSRLDVKGQKTNLRFIKREAVETEPGAQIQHTVYALQIGKKWHNFSSYGSELWLADFDG